MNPGEEGEGSVRPSSEPRLDLGNPYALRQCRSTEVRLMLHPTKAVIVRVRGTANECRDSLETSVHADSMHQYSPHVFETLPSLRTPLFHRPGPRGDSLIAHDSADRNSRH